MANFTNNHFNLRNSEEHKILLIDLDSKLSKEDFRKKFKDCGDIK
jgi:hypothetical protein